MEITLYSFSKRVNSTRQPDSGSGLTLDATLKDTTSKYSPTFILNRSPLSYHYLQWGSRYYYIREINIQHNGLYEVVCDIDVLATWKTQILNTNAFVQYSSSNFDDGIVDERLSTIDDVSIDFNSVSIISQGSTYILSYATDTATFGPAGCIWLTAGQAQSLASILNTTGFNDFLENTQKQFQGAYDSLLGCKYVPLPWAGGGGAEIVLGGYSTGITGQVPSKTMSYSAQISIPWQYEDFRNLQPYTTLLMYLPAYGFIDINPADYIGRDTIPITLTIDGITGEGTYIIGNKARVTCTFANDVPIGTVATNPLGLIGGVAKAVAGAVATGGIGGIVAGIPAVINSQQRDIGNTGSLGGGSSVMASPVSFGQIVLYSITHDTNQPPSSLGAIQGRPCLKVLNLGTLSGYCQTVNVSVSCNAPSYLKEQINNLLNGGVYLE